MRLSEQERQNRAKARAVKAFRKTVLTKDVLSFSKSENGFIEIKYSNGQTFKCRGPIVEEVGLL